VTAGTGHRRAAEALAQAAAERFPQATIECLDVLHLAPAWFRTGYNWSYLFLVRHVSGIWRVSYRLLDGWPLYHLLQPLRRWWNLLIVQRFVERLRVEPPDIVLVTHFLPADVCGAGRQAGWLRCPLVVVVTDLHPHRFWLSAPRDALVVSTPQSAQVAIRRGVEQGKIRVLGIPIGKAFGSSIDRRALQQRFQLQPGRQTILVTSGGTTVGQFEEVVEALIALEASLPGRLQLLVVCGEDERTRSRLLTRAGHSPMPVQVFGFVEFMADLMAVSDLIVSKAGGLTVSESLGRGVPLVLYHIIPGQEQLNARYVSAHGAGIIARRPGEVARAVAACIMEPARLETMRRAAHQISHPQAAARIMAEVVEPLVSHG